MQILELNSNRPECNRLLDSLLNRGYFQGIQIIDYEYEYYDSNMS